MANFNSLVGDTTKVGRYPAGASPYGVLDMAGNVYEWAADWFSPAYYQNSPANNPAGPSSGNSRLNRSGSWSSSASIVRSAGRDGRVPGSGSDKFGFRCAALP